MPLPSVTISPPGSICAYVFVSNDRGEVGICADPHQPPFVIFWSKAQEGGSHAPGLAIGLHDEGDAFIQVPGPDGSMRSARQISLNSVLDALSKLVPPAPQ